MGIRKILCLASIALSCSQINAPVDSIGDMSGEYERVVMVMPSCEFDEGTQTRNEVLLSSGIKYVWSATDTVGIFPTSGSQLYFSMASGAGEVSAAFDGGGWALVRGSEYFSYFPFIPDFYIDKTAVPLTFVGQSQVGNADPAHAYLGNYCYMAAKGEYDQETDALYFNYQRLGVLFRFMIPAKAGIYESLTVSVDDDILVQNGTYDAMAVDQMIYDPVYSDSLTIEFSDLVLDTDGTLVAFMMLPPFDVSTGQLTLKLRDAAGVEHVASVPGKNYILGKTYNNAPSFSVSMSSLEIDGKGGDVSVNIHGSGGIQYGISTDCDWLITESDKGEGTGSIKVTALANKGAPRKGTITVSETAGSLVLQNILTVTQLADGMNVGIGGWNQGNDDGGTAD